MTTVVLVRTPLNVICAREAVSHFGIDPSSVVLGVFDHDRPAARRQLWSSLEDTGLLDHVRSVSLLTPIVPVKSMRNVRQMAQHLGGPVDDLIIGSYMLGPFRQLMDLVEPRRTILVDDGAATERVAARRATWTAGGRADPHLRWSNETTLENTADRLRGPLGRLLARTAIHPGYYADIASEPDQLTIFTYLELPQSVPDPIVRLTFDSLRADIAGAPRNDATLFLGSPLVRTGKVDRAEYLSYLDRAQRTVGDFVYLPHRHERPEDLRAIEQQTGVTIRHPSRCIELAIGRDLPVPERVVAPWSSALETLAVLLAGVTSIGHLPLPVDSFRPAARTRAARRYDHLASLRQTPIERLALD